MWPRGETPSQRPLSLGPAKNGREKKDL